MKKKLRAAFDAIPHVGREETLSRLGIQTEGRKAGIRPARLAVAAACLVLMGTLGTALALAAFDGENCDYAVIEVGMGGRLDSTNVLTDPLLSVITGIALDHTAFLGNTVEAIATEKAGIIRLARGEEKTLSHTITIEK